MDWLSFFSAIFQNLVSLIGSLVWPALIFLILFHGKNEVIELLRSIKTLKYNGNEVTFERDSSKAAVAAEKAIPFKEVNKDSKLTLLSYPPRYAVIEAWLLVQKAAYNFIERKTGTPIKNKTALRMGGMLKELGVLNNDQIEVFELLRNLRNKAAHAKDEDSDYSPESVANYVNSALSLSDYLNSLEA